MKKKIFTIIFFLILLGIFVYIISNRQVSNQIIISGEDIYDSLFEKDSSITETENITINNLTPKNTTFYYNLLTDNQKSIYLDIANSIKKLDHKASLKNYVYADDETTMQDIKIAVEKLFLDHPEIFYVDNDYTVSTVELLNSKRIEVQLNYLVSDKADLEDKLNQINAEIEPIVKKTQGMNSFDAELYIHDKICENVSYYQYTNINDVPNECHSIYGSFILKKAVCDGLSKALQITLDKAGIENIIITGSLQNQAHAWNLVKLDNDWYHVDLTSDKSIRDTNGNEKVIHSYFNISTEKIKLTNTIDLEDKIPQANATDNNYYIKTGKYINITDDFSAKFKDILNSNENDELLEIGIDTRIKSVPEKMVYVLKNGTYSKYVNKNSNKLNYYNVLNTYVIINN